MTSARKTLPRLDFDYPPGTVERVCAEADKQGRDLAQAATADELRQAWRDEGHDYELPRDEQYLDMVRCWHQGHQANRLRMELGMALKAECERDNAVRARAAVADFYGLDPAALDGKAAVALLEEAERHAWELRKAVAWGSAPSERAAATRAETHCDRLENYLMVAGLVSRDEDDGHLIYADALPEAS